MPFRGSTLVPILSLFALASPSVHAQNSPPAYAPLTASERLKSYLNHTVASPIPYLGEAIAAGIGQLNDTPPEWEQGAAGYGRRFASSFGFVIVSSTIREGGDALLGYDPRYQRCYCQRFVSRTGHAILWSFLTRNSAGSTRFDFPTLAGAYGASMIEMYWYPHRYNPLSDGVRIGTQQLGIIVGTNILREFAPEVRRVLHRNH